MPFLSSEDVYSAREIALAAGVSEAQVSALMGAGSGYVGRDEAVRIGRVALLQARRSSEQPVSRAGLFEIFSEAPPTIGSKRVFALSSTVHATVLASCLFMAAFNLAPRAASLKLDEQPANPMRLVFLMTPGPGGGGGGGGLVQKAPPPKALREGHERLTSPLPIRREPKPIVPVPEPPKPPPPPPPLAAETLPAVVAPIVTAPADTRNRVGCLCKTRPRRTRATVPARAAAQELAPAPALARATAAASDRDRAAEPAAVRTGPAAVSNRRVSCERCDADYARVAAARTQRRGVLEIVVRHNGSVGDIRIFAVLPAA